LSLKPQRIILKPFIQEIAETVKQKNENISIELSIDENISVIADEFHFSNIIYNILDNSIKYCETSLKSLFLP
jgi:two-component system phosphate regulon sensor histidine kinase PhoR